jgi:transposase
MKRTRSWEVSDELWERVRPLLPERAPHPKGLCCKNSRGNTMGVKPHFLLSLGSHSKQAGDERDLPHDVPFFHATHLPFPHHVHDLISL